MFYQVQTWRALCTGVCRKRITCATVFYQQIENGNTADQIRGLTIDYRKFILKLDQNKVHVFYFLNKQHSGWRETLGSVVLHSTTILHLVYLNHRKCRQREGTHY